MLGPASIFRILLSEVPYNIVGWPLYICTFRLPLSGVPVHGRNPHVGDCGKDLIDMNARHLVLLEVDVDVRL